MEKVRDFFNTTDNYLHKSFGVHVRADIVRSFVGYPTARRILDLGCGNGVISSQFIEANEVTFVDLSENMISLVKNNLPPESSVNANLLVGSMFDLSLGNGYDYVLAIGLLAHVPSVSECVKRISYLVKDGGTAIIQFSDYRHWLTRMNIRNSAHYEYMINRLPYPDLKDIVLQHGFQIEKEVRFSLLLPGMGRLPDGFLYRYSKFILRSKLASRMGTDYMWLLKKNSAI